MKLQGVDVEMTLLYQSKQCHEDVCVWYVFGIVVKEGEIIMVKLPYKYT